jgi:hypothetical protein
MPEPSNRLARVHVFLDDSGDPGVKFGRGSTQHLVMAACVFRSAQAMEFASHSIRLCREQIGRGERWEFKYSKTSNTMKAEFFAAVRDLDFDVRAIVIDKQRLYSQTLTTVPKYLQNFAIKQLLTHSFGTIQDAKLVIDGRDSRAFRVGSGAYFRREVNEECPGTLRAVACEDSSRNMLIQLADMIAGAIHRNQREDRADATDHMRAFSSKLRYPRGSLWFFK